MARVVPSQAVTLIDGIFPWAAAEPPVQDVSLEVNSANSVSALVEIVEQIPEQLITLEGKEYAAFATSLASLNNALRMWPTRGTSFQVGPGTPGFGRIHPIALLRSVLVKCADAAPIPGTSDLLFIPDDELRDSLRQDISTSHTALINGEWKAATVLAGSVVEALLLWALQKKDATDVTASVDKLVGNRTLNTRPDPDIRQWGLHHLIEVAHDMTVVGDKTTAQCRLAKDFRNLIHPGKAERLQQKCDRGTALAALAAMEQVIADLQ